MLLTDNKIDQLVDSVKILTFDNDKLIQVKLYRWTERQVGYIRYTNLKKCIWETQGRIMIKIFVSAKNERSDWVFPSKS